MVQDGIEDGVCEGFPSLFCVQVGFVGADSEAGIEPEDTRFGEGREVPGWVPSRFEKWRGKGVSDARNERKGKEERKRLLTLSWEGKSQGCRSRAVYRCS